jgi:Tol biopolymer transport system component
MTTTPPARAQIGPYRIVARVGAGGMGEVFKAWDPRLERDVAIKLLHPEMAADPDRQKRLLAEGRAASALNHPNIVRVYDADVDDTSYYLVSEWLEGKSLRDELSRGPLPVRRLLDLAVQIADGLAAAHAAGIVHRDIKPENIMLARDGTARIVDFGLARSDPQAPGMSTAIGQAATVTASLDGGLSGTPAYMSPEQARGTAGDFRTDQFSFGALMYEMATGHNAFRRDTMADTLSAVLNDEPKAITAINPRIPRVVTWVIEQCLSKDSAERYGATEDLARELRRVRERLREAHMEPGPVARGEPRRWAMPVAILVAAVLTAAGMLAIPRPMATLRFTPIASAAGYEGTPVWSPDGQSLAWVGDVDGVLQVFTRRLNDAVATQITRGRFDAEQPFWAPDSRGLYFISAAGDGNGLWHVGTAGGRAELLLENVNHAAIDPSGRQLAVLRSESSMRQRLWWASANGGDLVHETRGRFGLERGFGLGGQLQFRPDGRALLVWVFNDRQEETETSSAYFLVPTERDAEVRDVLSSVPSTASLPPVSWLPDNRHVVVGIADASGGMRHLWIADTESPAISQLTSTHTNETWPSASPDGQHIAYASEEVDFDLVAISEDGRTQSRALATARNEMDPAWSPDGEQYAFVTDRAGSMGIWVRSRDGQWERPLVRSTDFDGSRTETIGSLAFSPDGRTLAFHRRGTKQATIWLVPVTGGAPVELLADDPGFSYHDAPAWSPDGDWIAYTRSVGPEFSLAKVRVGTKETATLLDRVTPFSRSVWSPDGAWIATEAGTALIRVPSNGGSFETILPEPPLAYSWVDARRLVALVSSESIGHLAMVEIDTLTKQVRTLNPDLGTIPVANQPIRGFSFVKGRGFLTSLASARSDIWLLDGFRLPRHNFPWLQAFFR